MYDTVNMVRVFHFDQQEIEQRAKKTGFNLTSQHWDAIAFINKFYDYHENEQLKVSDYNKALKGKYSNQGGLKYLYSLFPDGPVNTITQLANIPVNSVRNQSMGSVQ